MGLTADEKASLFFDQLCTDIENAIWRYDVSEEDRILILRSGAGLSLAATLEYGGILAFLRTVFVSIFIRIKYPSILEVKDANHE